ncbi:APC10-like protein [Mya arenaria]|uniref:Anaphase-promoting complex subunit 10 n=1 Tax=Mya arenaria TaxID=6604 RepID=A0ABY7DKH5_MYAAR|nr:APC10-like protein [Mya arenaria]
MATKVTASQELDVFKDEKEGLLREVSRYGVEQLREDSSETYWQSDGPQPHLVNIQFQRKTTIQDVCIYTDFKADESYTPNRISIRAGSHFNDLAEIEQIELGEPIGWVCVPLKDLVSGKPIRTFMIQIAVLSNHQNGRDTHIRRIKIRSPVQKYPMFTSLDFNMKANIR